MRARRGFRAAGPLLTMTTLALLCVPAGALGQERSATVPGDLANRDRRWTLTLGLGEQIGGAAGSLEATMRDAGYDATTPPGCVFIFCTNEPTEHPRTRDEGLAALLALRYAVHPRFSLEALATRGATGETTGRTEASWLDGVRLSVNHSIQTFGVLGSSSVRVTESGKGAGILRLGLGPALYVVETARAAGGSRDDVRSDKRLGFLVEAGLETPARSRVFLDLRMQWRYVGTSSVGPYELSRFPEDPVTFGESRARWDHFFVWTGVGVRL